MGYNISGSPKKGIILQNPHMIFVLFDVHSFTIVEVDLFEKKNVERDP